MYIGLRVKYPLFLSDFKKLEFSQEIFEKYSNTKFNENPSSGSRVFPRGRTDMSQLAVAFRNFSKAHKNEYSGCIEGVTFLDQLCVLTRIQCMITLMFAYNLGTGTQIYMCSVNKPLTSRRADWYMSFAYRPKWCNNNLRNRNGFALGYKIRHGGLQLLYILQLFVRSKSRNQRVTDRGVQEGSYHVGSDYMSLG